MVSIATTSTATVHCAISQDNVVYARSVSSDNLAVRSYIRGLAPDTLANNVNTRSHLAAQQVFDGSFDMGRSA